jgi:hypothetical protein
MSKEFLIVIETVEQAIDTHAALCRHADIRGEVEVCVSRDGYTIQAHIMRRGARKNERGVQMRVFGETLNAAVEKALEDLGSWAVVLAR